MALIDCPECGKEISDTTTSCPSCGAKTPKKSKGTSRLTLFVAGLFLIGVAAAIVNPKEQLSEADKQTADKSKAEDFARFKFASVTAKFLKGSMRDPESFVVESMLINQEANVACVEYRSKNGFGGMNRESALVIPGVISRKPEEWNKKCAGKSLIDFTKEALSATK